MRRTKTMNFFGANRHFMPFENHFQNLYPCDVSAKLGSTLFKDSRDIQIANFGPVD
jgi:hypothetical protein